MKEDYAVFFSDNSAVNNVAVDPNFPFHGFTVPLIATYEVIPCEWHHIKLAIADVTDGGVNSGVFLQEGSFSSPPVNQIEVESNVVNVFNSSSEFIDNLYEADYNDKKVIVKGCGSLNLDESVYIAITKKLQNVVSSLMFGEACSSVPVLKNKKYDE